MQLVLETGPGNLPAVGVWAAKTGQFCSRPIQQSNLLTDCKLNPDRYPSTGGLCQVWLDLSVLISSCAFQVSHLSLCSDMQLLIVKYCDWYVTVYFRCIGRLNDQIEMSHAPYQILIMSINRSSTILVPVSWVICGVTGCKKL